MNEFKLSIITISLNAERTIEQTLESVTSQSLPVEYIIIDGGSTDKTLQIVEKYRDRISVVISEPDDGISDAFNKGLNIATGEYIGIINADDFYEPDIFNKIVKFLIEEGRPDVIHGSLRYIDKNKLSYLERPRIDMIWRFMSVFHPTMFIRRDAYSKIGKYLKSYNYAMDSEWVHRALVRKLVFKEYPGVISNMRYGGVSHQFINKSLKEFQRSATSHGANMFCVFYYRWRQQLVQTLVKFSCIKKVILSIRKR